MKNHYFPKFIALFSIGLFLVLFASQQGLSVLAADPAQVDVTTTITATVSPTITATVTPTVTASPTPDCDLVVPGDFLVIGGDDLQFTVTNLNPQTIYLTDTTLFWTDYYDPNMYVDYFYFGPTQYWKGDGYDSPSIINGSGVFFSGDTSEDWNLDFDGYGNSYGQTHTIGPFTVELTFNGDCLVSAEIPPVEAEIKDPNDGQIITRILETDFEVKAWDTGVGHTNGAGINRVHLVILDSNGNVLINKNDTIAPFCAWGDQDRCPVMSDELWNTLPNGTFQLIAWARSGVTSSWSPPVIASFTIQHGTLPTATPTTTPRPTKTPIP